MSDDASEPHAASSTRVNSISWRAEVFAKASGFAEEEKYWLSLLMSATIVLRGKEWEISEGDLGKLSKGVNQEHDGTRKLEREDTMRKYILD